MSTPARRRWTAVVCLIVWGLTFFCRRDGVVLVAFATVRSTRVWIPKRVIRWRRALRNTGGREKWDGPHAVRKLALELRALNRSGLHVETVENRKRSLALELVGRAFDRDGDGRLNSDECRRVRLILYGHSFGGAAVIKFARQIEALVIIPLFCRSRLHLPASLRSKPACAGLGFALGSTGSPFCPAESSSLSYG